jgi:hypothetical protein
VSTPGALTPALNASREIDSSFDVSFISAGTPQEGGEEIAASPSSLGSGTEQVHGLLRPVDRQANDAYLMALQRRRGAFNVQAPSRAAAKKTPRAAVGTKARRRAASYTPSPSAGSEEDSTGATGGISLKAAMTPGGTTTVQWQVDQDARAEAELLGDAAAAIDVQGGRLVVDEEAAEQQDQAGEDEAGSPGSTTAAAATAIVAHHSALTSQQRRSVGLAELMSPLLRASRAAGFESDSEAPAVHGLSAGLLADIDTEESDNGNETDSLSAASALDALQNRLLF